MKKNQVIGWLLWALAVGTVVGMVLNSDAYWALYNYATLLVCVVSGVVLLNQKP
jgi:hypothetical protein